MSASVKHKRTDLLREIRKVDPNFNRDSQVVPKYEFTRRKFEGKESTQAIYDRTVEDDS